MAVLLSVWQGLEGRDKVLRRARGRVGLGLGPVLRCVNGAPRIVVGSGGGSVCGFPIVLEEDNGECRYVKGGGVGVRVEGSGKCRVEIHPVPPCFYPERVTRYMMLVFEEPVYLKAGVSREKCVVHGLDYVVGDPSAPLDVFTTARPAKYALYGPPSTGILVRRVLTRFTSCTQPGGGPCTAVTRLVLRNRSSGPVLVGRVVVDCSYYRVTCCSSGLCGDTIVVDVASPFTARVMVGENTGSWQVDPVKLLSRSFVMRYGLA